MLGMPSIEARIRPLPARPMATVDRGRPAV